MDEMSHKSSKEAGTGFREEIHILAAGLLGSLVFGAVFFFLARQAKLMWTPIAVIVLGIVLIFIIAIFRFVNFFRHFLAWSAYALLIFACYYVESHYELVIQQKSPAPPNTTEVQARLPPEDLVGSFSGFRTKSGGGREFLVLTIEDVVRQPIRLLFHYSIYEGASRTKGQGIIFSSSSTIQFADRTIMHYERTQDGAIVLQALNRDNFWLSRAGS